MTKTHILLHRRVWLFDFCIAVVYSRSDEHILSEIYLLAMNCRTLKKGQIISLRLPYYQENTELFSLQLLSKPADQEDWSVKECVFNVRTFSFRI